MQPAQLYIDTWQHDVTTANSRGYACRLMFPPCLPMPSLPFCALGAIHRTILLPLPLPFVDMHVRPADLRGADSFPAFLAAICPSSLRCRALTYRPLIHKTNSLKHWQPWCNLQNDWKHCRDGGQSQWNY